MNRFHPNDFSIHITSPGVAPHHPIFSWVAHGKRSCISEIEFALSEMGQIASLEDREAVSFIGITGTNGKTTTVELTTHLFNHVGRKAEACGNIGRPLIECVSTMRKEGVKRGAQIYVVELSSYQIERIRSPFLTSCAWLNVAPDHLDWHRTLEAYRASKEKLLSLVIPSHHARAVLHDSLGTVSLPNHVRPVWYNTTPSHRTAVHVQEGELVEREGRFPLPKELQETSSTCDIENFLASYLLVREFGVDRHAIVGGYDSFRKGPHRLQHIVTRENVAFYDDSKGTNVHATLAAVRSVPAPVVLIVGGVHKGHPYTEWAAVFPGLVHTAIVMGQAKEAIVRDLGAVVPIVEVHDLQQAVARGWEIARGLSCQYGRATVLLSPGCASFDMFRDYRDRGCRFQALVYEESAR